jgi:hypothetical protein
MSDVTGGPVDRWVLEMKDGALEPLDVVGDARPASCCTRGRSDRGSGLSLLVCARSAKTRSK